MLSAWVTGCLLLLVACGEVDSPAADHPAAEGTSSAFSAVPHSWATADGNSMPYEIGGNAEARTTVVMIHGWMCNRTFWDAQLSALAPRYRTLTVDLPGHGEATADRERWSYAGFGEDVAGLLGELGLQQVVLVGHSAGSLVALHVASRAPGSMLGIVAVDALQNVDFELSEEQAEASILPFEQEFVETCENFMLGMFLEGDEAAVKERVVEASCRPERATVGAALIRDYLESDWPALLRQAGVPVRAVNSAMFPTNMQGNRRYADFDAVIMDDVGHFLHMTRAGRFNEHLLEAIASIAGQGGGTE